MTRRAVSLSVVRDELEHHPRDPFSASTRAALARLWETGPGDLIAAMRAAR